MENENIDPEHPVMLAFREAGYHADSLHDPGTVDPDDLPGGWQVVQFVSNGVERFDVAEVRESDRPGADRVAVFGSDQRLPVGYDGHLYDDGLPSLERLNGAANPRVSLMAAPGSGDDVPSFSEAEAVVALSRYGSEGFVPRPLADSLMAALGGSLSDSAFRDDPDVDGGQIMRASTLARRLASQIGDARSADSGLGGHKKTRRQRFYRNIEALQDHVDGDGS